MKRDTNFLKYKGYIGSVEFSLEDNILFGKVLGIPSLLSYEGETLDALKENFKSAINDYLEYFKDENIKPEKTNVGVLNVKLGADLYFRANREAQQQGLSLNGYVKKAIEALVTG